MPNWIRTVTAVEGTDWCEAGEHWQVRGGNEIKVDDRSVRDRTC